MMGVRCVTGHEDSAVDAALSACKLPSTPASLDVYNLFRTCLGVPVDPHELNSDGGVDLPAEAGLDYHHAVSYDKGCYVGQELTTRTHFTGTTRKLLLPVVPVPSPETPAPEPLELASDALFAPFADSVLGASFGSPLPAPGAELRVADSASSATEASGKRPRRAKRAGKMISRNSVGAGFAILRLEHLMSDAANTQFAALPTDDSADAAPLLVRPLLPSWWPPTQRKASEIVLN